MPGRRALLTRRDLLAAAPGLLAPLALGCRPRPPGELDVDLDSLEIHGRIVGASRQVGHRLRTGGFPEPSATRDVPVVIAGGGIAGLSAGWQLARRGFRDFEVLELESEAGGNARWGENEVSAYPWGAHYLPLPTPESTAVRELLEEMGLVEDVAADGTPIYDARHLCHAPQERVFWGDETGDGGWREGLSAQDLLAGEDDATLAAFDQQVHHWRGWRDAGGRPAFALPMAFSSDAAELRALDELSMAEHLDQLGLASPTLRWYLDYCCRDDYGCRLETTSAWAGWHYFCSRPAAVEYLTWPEGNGRIVRHLVDRIGAERLRTGTLVIAVRAAADGGRGAELDALDVATETVVRIRARRVIYALPRFTARWVIEGWEGRGDEAFTYSPWLVANLSVRRPPAGAAWDNVIRPSPSLGYVVATHQNLRLAPGPSVLTYYLPLAGADPAAERRRLEERGWSDWAKLVLADLAGAHPGIGRLVTRLDLMLWGHAMIRPVPGFIWGEARRRAEEPFGAVRFAHSDQSGLSLFEEAQYRGVRAADAVLEELGS